MLGLVLGYLCHHAAAQDCTAKTFSSTCSMCTSFDYPGEDPNTPSPTPTCTNPAARIPVNAVVSGNAARAISLDFKVTSKKLCGCVFGVGANPAITSPTSGSGTDSMWNVCFRDDNNQIGTWGGRTATANNVWINVNNDTLWNGLYKSWHHLVVNYDSMSLSVYLDAVFQGISTPVKAYETAGDRPGSQAVIGGTVDGTNQLMFPGVVRNFQFFTQPLSLGAISKLATQCDASATNSTSAPTPEDGQTEQPTPNLSVEPTNAPSPEPSLPICDSVYSFTSPCTTCDGYSYDGDTRTASPAYCVRQHSRIAVTAPAEGDMARSVVMHLKPERTRPVCWCVFGQGNATDSMWNVCFNKAISSVGIWRGATSAANVWVGIDDFDVFSNGGFHHLAVTYDNTTGVSVYVDGVFRGSGKSAKSFATHGERAFLGGSADAKDCDCCCPGMNFHGQIKNFQYFARAITAQEVEVLSLPCVIPLTDAPTIVVANITTQQPSLPSNHSQPLQSDHVNDTNNMMPWLLVVGGVCLFVIVLGLIVWRKRKRALEQRSYSMREQSLDLGGGQYKRRELRQTLVNAAVGARDDSDEYEDEGDEEDGKPAEKPKSKPKPQKGKKKKGKKKKRQYTDPDTTGGYEPLSVN